MSGRLFPDQAACAVYTRERLTPLVAQVAGRAEVAPFATPVAVVEPLHVAVHVFPIDGELPTLIGVTDRLRLIPILQEAQADVRSSGLRIVGWSWSTTGASIAPPCATM